MQLVTVSLRIGSTESKDTFPVTEEEIAAALAAVSLFIEEEETNKVVVAQSNWHKQSKLDSLRQMRRPAGVLWSLTLLALSSVLAAPAQESKFRPTSQQSAFRPAQPVYNEETDSAPKPTLLARANGRPQRSAPAIEPLSLLGEKGKIKVQLFVGSRLDLDLPDGAKVYNLADGTLVSQIAPQSNWSLTLAKKEGITRFALSGKTPADKLASALKPKFQTVAFTPSSVTMGSDRFLDLPVADTQTNGYLIVTEKSGESAPLLGVNGNLYRGALILRPVNTVNAAGPTTVMRVINLVALEDYLLSVVPSEVPSGWPLEVLKAQAIAARSYACANLGKHKVDGYDVKCTVEDQVYRGVSAEAESTNLACAQTSGLVLKHNNKVISAFFHSTSGGSTELAETVWGKNVPYLKAVADFDDASPHFNWQKSYSVDKLAAQLFSPPEPLLAVFVVGRHPGDSKRAKDILFVGQNNSRLLSGTEVRRILNLPSTQFSIYQAENNYILSGRGFGHGLGLSQWGGKALADSGYNAGQILSYYYRDITIESLGTAE